MRGIEDSIKTAGGSVRPNSFNEERHDVSNEPDPPAPLEFFYRIQSAKNDGDNFEIQEIAGKTDANGTIKLFLPEDSTYVLSMYNPATDLYGTKSGVTATSSATTDLGTIHVTSREYSDSDGDKLGDIAEFVIGTSLASPDSDGDGVSDLAEVKSNQDPLSGIADGVLSTDIFLLA